MRAIAMAYAFRPDTRRDRDHMDLADLKVNWERLSQRDAFHSILYVPAMAHGKWDAEAFFASGVAEIDELMRRLDAIGGMPARRKAMDFGCAAGRLTQALGAHFETVAGVDISAGMIDHARRFNRWGDACTYHVNTEPHLRLFDSNEFDLVYSNITLQHNAPRYTAAYIREFVRVVKPGGMLAFQLPARNLDSWRHRVRLQAPYRLKKAYRRVASWIARGADRVGKVEMPMYTMRRRTVERLLVSAGAVVLQVVPNQCAGPAWESYWYFARKRST